MAPARLVPEAHSQAGITGHLLAPPFAVSSKHCIRFNQTCPTTAVDLSCLELERQAMDLKVNQARPPLTHPESMEQICFSINCRGMKLSAQPCAQVQREKPRIHLLLLAGHRCKGQRVWQHGAAVGAYQPLTHRESTGQVCFGCRGVKLSAQPCAQSQRLLRHSDMLLH
jgi:hypothetical protein